MPRTVSRQPATAADATVAEKMQGLPGDIVKGKTSRNGRSADETPEVAQSRLDKFKDDLNYDDKNHPTAEGISTPSPETKSKAKVVERGKTHGVEEDAGQNPGRKAVNEDEDDRGENEASDADDDGDKAEEAADDDGGMDDELARKALDLGISLKQASKMPPKILREVVSFIEDRAEILAEAKIRANGATTKAEKKEIKDAGEDALELIDTLSEETSDPDIVKGLKALKSVVTKAAKSKDIDESLSPVKAAQVEEFENWYDEALANREQYHDVLGDGNRRTSARQEAARVEVLTEMARIKKSSHENLSRRRLLERALARVFPEKQKAEARREVSEKMRARMDSALTRPTNRKMSEAKLTPTEQAVVEVRKKLRDFGLSEV